MPGVVDVECLKRERAKAKLPKPMAVRKSIGSKELCRSTAAARTSSQVSTCLFASAAEHHGFRRPQPILRASRKRSGAQPRYRSLLGAARQRLALVGRIEASAPRHSAR